eukprot:scaffold1727_cov198-Alexandrium_tamarense.AAC.16
MGDGIDKRAHGGLSFGSCIGCASSCVGIRRRSRVGYCLMIGGKCREGEAGEYKFDAMFDVSNKLHGLNYIKWKHADAYHPDVNVHEVRRNKNDREEGGWPSFFMTTMSVLTNRVVLG